MLHNLHISIKHIYSVSIHKYTYIYVYVCVCVCVRVCVCVWRRGIMITVVRKWARRTEFKYWTRLVAFFNRANTIKKRKMTKYLIVEKTKLFELNMATGLRERKFWIQTCLKTDLVLHPAHAERLHTHTHTHTHIYIYIYTYIRPHKLNYWK